jgi:protein TonB
VASDSEVTEENQMKDQAELQQTKTAIGVFNQEGTNDLNALTRDEAMLQAGVSGETGVKQKEKVYDFVQKMPSFPGGQSALYSYLGENIKYPPSASENGIEGKATITFVVERDGSITDVKIARGFDPACDSEAARVVRAMPKWVPGEQNGKTVRVQYTLPVFFQLQK